MLGGRWNEHQCPATGSWWCCLGIGDAVFEWFWAGEDGWKKYLADEEGTWAWWHHAETGRSFAVPLRPPVSGGAVPQLPLALPRLRPSTQGYAERIYYLYVDGSCHSRTAIGAAAVMESAASGDSYVSSTGRAQVASELPAILLGPLCIDASRTSMVRRETR